MIKVIKKAFVVIGKEGSTLDGAGFIQKLWDDANGHFSEVAHLAKKDTNGNIVGIWGAMSDSSHAFNAWEDGFSRGLYLAGVQIPVETEAPKGWVKWIVPAFDYLYGQVDGDPQTAVQLGLEEIKRQGLALSGAIQEYYCSQENGAMYLFFPIKQNCNEKLRKCIR